MRYATFVAITALAAPLSATHGQDALGTDNFNDGHIGAMWTAAAFGTQPPVERNGRLEFASAASNSQSLSGVVGTGWQLVLKDVPMCP